MPAYADDSSIADQEEVWRRIPPDQIHWDGKLHRWRPESGMFSDSSDGSPMSAGRAILYGSPRGILGDQGYPDHLLVAIDVAFLRELGLRVASDPPADDPGHVWIVGRKTKAVKKKLAKAARWVVGPRDESSPT